MHRLRIIAENFEAPTTLLIPRPGECLRASVEERAVDIPLISLELHEHYELVGLLDGGAQMAAALPYIWQGRRLLLRGRVAPLVNGPLLVVPLGFFNVRRRNISA